MTESPWTPITIHRLDRSITVQVQAPTPQAAAEALDPFVAEDVLFAGAGTSRSAAVHAILQTRLIESRAWLEQAQATHQKNVQAVIDHDAAEAAAELEPPATDVG